MMYLYTADSLTRGAGICAKCEDALDELTARDSVAVDGPRPAHGLGG